MGHIVALPFNIKNVYFNGKEELWKLKYFNNIPKIWLQVGQGQWPKGPRSILQPKFGRNLDRCRVVAKMTQVQNMTEFWPQSGHGS